jgi:hypothetical protein
MSQHAQQSGTARCHISEEIGLRHGIAATRRDEGECDGSERRGSSGSQLRVERRKKEEERGQQARSSRKGGAVNKVVGCTRLKSNTHKQCHSKPSQSNQASQSRVQAAHLSWINMQHPRQQSQCIRTDSSALWQWVLQKEGERERGRDTAAAGECQAGRVNDGMDIGAKQAQPGRQAGEEGRQRHDQESHQAISLVWR